ncbi:hypothetical protein [Saccharomonospora cyanea]|uniref:hypothetical protein n=1 Tax=Saccharomonospora cyanea TaxID=40989 RepID=UPI0002EEB0A0
MVAVVPTRDHTATEQSKNYRYSTHRQVGIDADTPPDCDDCKVCRNCPPWKQQHNASHRTVRARVEHAFPA